MYSERRTPNHTIQISTAKKIFSLLLVLFFNGLCFGQLNGTYTAGAPADDFPLIQDVIDTLELSGISGNVEIRISDGEYGQLELTEFSRPAGSKLVFTSASGNVDDVIFEAASLVESDGVELRYMTFNMPSPTLESSVVFINKSDSVTISNCRIIDSTSTWTVWNYAPLEIDHDWGAGFTTVFVDSCYIYSGDGILIPKSMTRQTVLEKGNAGMTYYKNDSIFGSINYDGPSSGINRHFDNCYLKVLQSLDGQGTQSIDSCEIIFYPWNLGETIGAGTISSYTLTNSEITARYVTIGAREIINCNFSGNFRTSAYANKKIINNYIAGEANISCGGTTLIPKPIVLNNVFSKYTYLSGGGGNEADLIVANNIFLDTVRKVAPGAGPGGGKVHLYHNNFANGTILYSQSPGDIVNNNISDFVISNRGNYITNNNYNWQDSSTLFHSYYDNSPSYYDPAYTAPTDLHVNNASIFSLGTYLTDVFLEEDFEEDVRDTIPTIGADETCLGLPFQDTIPLLCATNYTLKMCDFDTLIHHWWSNSVPVDTTVANPVVFVDTIITVFLRDEFNNVIDSTVLFPELVDSRKRNLYGYCSFDYFIATYNQPGVDVDWSPGYLFSDSTNHATYVNLDTTTVLVATQVFGQCGTRYDSIIFNINSDPQAYILLDSATCLDYKFRGLTTCYDSIQWSISDGTTYHNVTSIWHTFPEEGNYDVILNVWMYGSVDSDTISAYFTCLGYEEVIVEDFQLFPNPANQGYFNVILPPSLLGETYALYNHLGQEVRNGAITQEKMTIPTDGLTAGIYIVRMGRLTKKVVIQ